MSSIFHKISTVFTQPSLLFGNSGQVQTNAFPHKRVPDFLIRSSRGIWKGDPGFIKNGSEISSRQLFKRPLVIAFFSDEWKEFGADHLRKLTEIQYKVKSYGGHLLVITDAGIRELRTLVTGNALKLNIYSDPENIIAEKFGVYDAENPVYNRISGIEKNVPLLAAFVISPLRQILYKHVNTLKEHDPLPVQRLLEAVNLSAHIH